MELLELLDELLVFCVLLILTCLFVERDSCHHIWHHVKLFINDRSIRLFWVSFDSVFVFFYLSSFFLCDSRVPSFLVFLERLPEYVSVELGVGSVERVFIFHMLL